MQPILETKALRKDYTMGDLTVEVLRGIDFSVQAGEFVAIMGPSGSGKSTLLHLLGGLDRPSAGEIVLNGRALARLSDDEITVMRRRDLGFVFQFFNLLPMLSAAENVALPLLMDGKRPADYARQVDEVLALVDLSERKTHRPHQLSGGQQQRVAIARALVTQPQLILADEPTGNLDSNASEAVLQLLRAARDVRQRTIVMVTHDQHAAAFADRVVFLKDGHFVNELSFNGKEARRTQEVAAIMDVLRE